ncbi:CAP domain-containing protein [Nafulsella turpanensis]|uniref:CAP domain-containing protein n=1 Tax=Nafulsella turpanensis TaxID=1265690 RepID=UPI00034B91EC|nr:CAP domain-containing protein [Nafulsella turpanensis]
MRKISGLIVAGCLLLLALRLPAQTPIDVQSFDATLLQTLIAEKVDSVRQSHKKQPLAADAILQQAAVDHALYLAKKGMLSHFQEGNKKKYDPQDRVEFFGGIGYQTGENAAEHPVQVLLVQKKGYTVNRVETYEQSALLFIQQWVHSPMHFKNLVKEEFSRSGIAVNLDPKTKRIYAVQVFSPEPLAQ